MVLSNNSFFSQGRMMDTTATLMPNIQSVRQINMTTLSSERSTNPPTPLALQTEDHPRMTRTDSHAAQQSLTKLPPLTKVNSPTSVPSTGKYCTVKPLIHPSSILCTHLIDSPIHGHLCVQWDVHAWEVLLHFSNRINKQSLVLNFLLYFQLRQLYRNEDPRGKRVNPPTSPTKHLGASPADRGSKPPRADGGGDQLKAKSETNLYPDSREGPSHHPPAQQPHSPYYPAHSVPNLDQGPSYGAPDPSIMRNYEPHGRSRW